MDDCCATVTPELHQSSINNLKDRYCKVVDTNQAMDEVEGLLDRLNKSEVLPGLS